MANTFGSDTTMWVLPNGDFVHGVMVAVDTADWSLLEFSAFDNCPPSERAGLAKMIDATHRAMELSVVEITFGKN